jgi:hypothetical protein
MPYRVKWLIQGRGDSIVDPVNYPRVFEAQNFAISVLRYNPTDLWIEDENGRRTVEKQTIVNHHRRRGRK